MQRVSYEAAEPKPEPLPSPSLSTLKPIEIEHQVGEYPIDLVTALRLADADNLQIALAQEQIQQAYADYKTAAVLWLPSLRGGVHWNKHDGPLLDTAGNILESSRASLDAGLGSTAVGAGSPAIPGIFANFSIADAIFLPLAA